MRRCVRRSTRGGVEAAARTRAIAARAARLHVIAEGAEGGEVVEADRREERRARPVGGGRLEGAHEESGGDEAEPRGGEAGEEAPDARGALGFGGEKKRTTMMLRIAGTPGRHKLQPTTDLQPKYGGFYFVPY